MIGAHRFRVGQRVMPSAEGIRRNVFRAKDAERHGTVMKVDQFNGPAVLWDGRKTTSGYHPDFIEPAPRRKKTRRPIPKDRAPRSLDDKKL